MKTIFAFLRSRRRIGLCIVAMIVVAVSLAVAREGQTDSTYAPLAAAPQKARDQKNPFAGDPLAVAAGGKLFAQHCAECHGEKAEGARHGPSLLRAEVQEATPGSVFWILTNGVVRHGMPVWSKLPPPERWQIVAFLHSLKSSSMNTRP